MNENMDIINPETTYLLLSEFKHRFSIDEKPVQVNFRELVPQLSRGERFTHLIHPYPAKLICHIPYFFLQSDYCCPKDGIVLDPFCGSGTVLLEAILSGRNAYGADANPLARKISRVKTTAIDEVYLYRILDELLLEISKDKEEKLSCTDDNHFWFPRKTAVTLNKIINAIQGIKNPQILDFFEICISSIIKKVSYADPRISVPVRVNADKFDPESHLYKNAVKHLEDIANLDILELFTSTCKSNISRMSTLCDVRDGVTAIICSDDARRLTFSIGNNKLIENETIDLILTSPPYAGAQKYIRASSLNLRWLRIADNKEIRNLKNQNIGREDYRKSEISIPKTGIYNADLLLDVLFSEGKYERAHIVANYLNEMKIAIDESIRVLKCGGYFIMVIGNNTVCGHEFDTQAYLTEYMISKGLSLEFKLIDDIKSYGLMTKRNKTASRISCEYVLVLKK